MFVWPREVTVEAKGAVARVEARMAVATAAVTAAAARVVVVAVAMQGSCREMWLVPSSIASYRAPVPTSRGTNGPPVPRCVGPDTQCVITC